MVGVFLMTCEGKQGPCLGKHARGWGSKDGQQCSQLVLACFSLILYFHMLVSVLSDTISRFVQHALPVGT